MRYDDVVKKHLPINKKRTGKKLDFQYITIHNTGNPKSTAANERAWLTNPENTTSTGWHIVVDGKEAIEAIPLNEIAYHAGTSAGNSTSIGIEICDSAGLVAEKNAIELVASLLIQKGWGIERLKTHKDWSGKYCPHIILPRWTEFKNDIAAEIVKQKNESEVIVEKNIKEIEVFDKSGRSLGTLKIEL